MVLTTSHTRFTDFLSVSSFLKPDYLHPHSAWVQHIPFAFWLVEQLKPKVFVELGVHTGVSYFAFCQSVKANNLSTHCYGVDTWKGDEQSGFYADDIWAEVNKINEENYEPFSFLLKSTFNKALDHFEQGSIDLLHIDGLHSYEAVKEDFDNWLPKISSNGIVIFHDIDVKERDFGVYKLWDELKKKYRNFEFHHGYGLGIISLNNTNSPILDSFFELEDVFLQNNIRHAYATLGNILTEHFQADLNKKILEEQDKQIESLQQKLSEDEILKVKNEQRIQSLTEKFNKQQHKLSDLNTQLLKNKELISGLQTHISQQQQTIEWFSRTYQNRSLLGVVKEKLLSKYHIGKIAVKREMHESGSATNVEKDQYSKWCELYDTISGRQFSIINGLANELLYQPLFSIIMPVYNAPISYLKKAIESVQKQAYENWELCIADDASTDQKIKQLLNEYAVKDKRIKVVFRKKNGHISEASNSALELATGNYIVLLDQDDELRPHSLFMVANAINNNKELEIIYSDEDKIDEQGNRFDPYFKTDWNKDLFYGQNMISHLGVYKLSLVRKINGFRIGFEGSQDYDLALRCIEQIKDDQIYHIPHVLYHWRAVSGSTALEVSNKDYAYKAGVKALTEHLCRTKANAVAIENVNNSFRVKWNLPLIHPKVSIIIPTKDKVDVLRTCINSILKKTNYSNFEILIIDNQSDEPGTFEFYNSLKTKQANVQVFTYQHEFNFSAMVNYGVNHSTGEIILLLNNDTEVINEDWMDEMVSQCMRKDIGVVGAKLYFPNGKIQHAGVFLNRDHPGIHIYYNKEGNDPGYFNKLNLVQNYSAVTAACLCVRKEIFLKAGGFDEVNLKVAYNDVDFCLKVTEKGYRNLWTPFSKLYHYESLSRGSDLEEKKLLRFRYEQNFMRKKWKDILLHDPFFNGNLSCEPGITQYAFPPAVRLEWQNQNITNNETV